ncbi:uncharacterized protein PGTG_09823 [Puccinia graminis f. sp. tritici CRL 75-36-700-3]|uniref:Uncharacterized protein n=1 Tax=Puccinia graminis f. sp. tritici (strain CRL 75-36-700-3 / race SCCL) TaxID=418459 RepID=E3KF24_PUCGT|nr:uncharacterized protein PGTG_09823 [Puccinia graminis f. sp. tritici CRL 75-36-700-3]EFP82855.1 hypothetical protein PGTG_09823 [Puccinia graminis f. sp. tritici CRL 75-36-700-3]
MTKGAAYERFAIYMNDQTHKRLHLDGKLLRQRMEAYKKKFVAAKKWADNTGAGIEEGDNNVSIDDLLETKCPCYKRMSALFGEKPNVTPAAQYKSQEGMPLYNQPGDNGDLEMFYAGWDATQEVLDHSNVEQQSPGTVFSGREAIGNQDNQTSPQASQQPSPTLASLSGLPLADCPTLNPDTQINPAPSSDKSPAAPNS